MLFSIKKVETPADKNQFIRLPWEIYSDLSAWVPPLGSERKKFLSPKTNPFSLTLQVVSQKIILLIFMFSIYTQTRGLKKLLK